MNVGHLGELGTVFVFSLFKRVKHFHDFAVVGQRNHENERCYYYLVMRNSAEKLMTGLRFEPVATNCRTTARSLELCAVWSTWSGLYKFLFIYTRNLGDSTFVMSDFYWIFS